MSRIAAKRPAGPAPTTTISGLFSTGWYWYSFSRLDAGSSSRKTWNDMLIFMLLPRASTDLRIILIKVISCSETLKVCAIADM